MRIEVLGTPSVVAEAGTVAGTGLGGRRVQVVLVALALERGTIPAERLAAMVWSGYPPPTWRAALRGVVRELRAALAPIGGGGQHVIVTEPPGYRLADGVEVDVMAAAAAARESAAVCTEGRFRAALTLAEPLSRLSGAQVLPDDDNAWLDAHRAAIDALAHQATEIVATAAGRLGEHAVAVAAARRAHANPLDERAHRGLIIVLDRAGDPAGAVRAFEECRSQLAEHLGVDPSAETVQIYLAALQGQARSSPARIPAQNGLIRRPGSGGGQARPAARAAGAHHRHRPRRRRQVPARGEGRGVGQPALTAAGSGCRSDPSRTMRWWPPPSPSRSASRSEPRSRAAAVTSYLAPVGRALLVLDGCEVALDGVASLITALLGQCPMLTVLATSRMPLRCDHEVLLPLVPLPGPGPDAEPSWRASPVAQLLVDRVCDSGGAISLDEDMAPYILALLRRCAGLPLAVELAAAQLAAIPAGDLLDQLSPLLGDGSDPVRAIATGSYALLDEHEAAVFRRLGVLDGSAGLALVREVVSGAAVPAVRVVRILRELTASGLVSVDRMGAQSVYHQADELHRFAREMLQEHGEEQPAFGRLASAIRAVLPEDARDPPGAHSRTRSLACSDRSARCWPRASAAGPTEPGASSSPSGCTGTGRRRMWPKAGSGCPGCSPGIRTRPGRRMPRTRSATWTTGRATPGRRSRNCRRWCGFRGNRQCLRRPRADLPGGTAR